MVDSFWTKTNFWLMPNYGLCLDTVDLGKSMRHLTSLSAIT
ncbi:hypothetical protein GPAL_0705 [Glaciecola pallidula DSM 14239 = ACAM 615]|uniref:Uncharacterized protein n=1 Tax=Brumicola pallidula DSM 14239 = ACAM 615 TaxID=1121922 RepID=K6ZW88_9ALTE|nr:hypothetical protein GPAL_0705 [Glaciecola pallidula DSM 14239 = ACAM 615]